MKYKQFQIKLTRIIESAQAKWNHKDFENAGSDRKKVWKRIGRLLKRKQKSGTNLPLKLLNNSTGQFETDPLKIANELNKHFLLNC